MERERENEGERNVEYEGEEKGRGRERESVCCVCTVRVTMMELVPLLLSHCLPLGESSDTCRLPYRMIYPS